MDWWLTLRYKCITEAPLKTATLPALRVPPRLRKELEAVLEPDETLSHFIEDAVRARLEWRLAQLEFIEQGLVESDRARRAGDYVDAADVVRRLDAVVSAARHRGKRR